MQKRSNATYTSNRRAVHQKYASDGNESLEESVQRALLATAAIVRASISIYAIFF